MTLDSLLAKAESMPSYPVDGWHPSHQGSIDIHIKSTGQWLHEGREIKRTAIKQLFSRLLTYRQGDYWLVTPTEQLKITVETLPFVIIKADYIDDIWHFITDVGDKVQLTQTHQWHFQAQTIKGQQIQIPSINVRDNLWAHFSRQTYYDLALTVQPNSQQAGIGSITSNGKAFMFGYMEG